MRRVIGAENIRDAFVETFPDRLSVRFVAHRRIHLYQGAEPFVIRRPRQCQMVRRDFDGSDVLVFLQQRHFLRGGDMQNVNARAGFARDPQQALRA